MIYLINRILYLELKLYNSNNKKKFDKYLNINLLIKYIMQNEYIKNRGKIILTTDVNHLKWKNYIRSKLALNWDCFVEILMDNNTHCTIVDTNEVFDLQKGDFTNIGKNTLMFLLKEVCKEYSYNYFITTRSIYDSSNYYIVLSFIH